MEKRTPALLLLLLVAVFGTLGMACFFSAVPVPNHNTSPVVAAVDDAHFYDFVFDQNSVEYEVLVHQNLMNQYNEQILNASNPVYSFTYSHAYYGQLNDQPYAYRIPSSTVFTFLRCDLWYSDLQYVMVDTTNYITIELSKDHLSMIKVNTNEVLWEYDFETAYCDEIVLNWERMELTLKDGRKQVKDWTNVPDGGWKFDYFVMNQVYYEGVAPTVTMECFRNQTGYSFSIDFIDSIFPEHNKNFGYSVDLETDTIIVADIEGLVPEVGNTGDYVFLGWYSGDKTPADSLSGNICFYAKYKEAIVTFKNSAGKWLGTKSVYIGDTYGVVVKNLGFQDYAAPLNLDLNMVVTGDCEITLAEKLFVTLKYFKLERYSVEVEGKTFKYDMLTYKTVSQKVAEGTLVDVNAFDSATYNILGKPYYETMPGFTFTGWDYDLTQPITAPLTITAQYELPKIKVNYYSSNDILFETREYDLVNDGLLLPVTELPKSNFWDEFKNALANLLTLDIVQEVDDVLARLAADKMIDHLNGLYDDATNQIFAIVAKPDMNSDVYKGWQGDLSGDLEGSAFVRLKGSALNNNYVLYLNPTSMYIDNINYEIALSFGDHVIDPVINGVQNFFTGAWDWLSENWQTVLYVVGAAVAIILLIVFGPIVLPVIVVVVKFIAKAIKICFKAIGKVLGAIWTGIKRFCQWVGELFNKIFRRGK